MVLQLLLSAGKETREKFSGALEAFSRRNPSSSSPHGDLNKNRNFEDVPSHRDVVNTVFPKGKKKSFEVHQSEEVLSI